MRSASSSSEEDLVAGGADQRSPPNSMWKYVKSSYKKLMKNPLKNLEIIYSARVACNACDGDAFVYHFVTVYKQDGQSRLVQINKGKEEKDGSLVKGDIISTLQVTPRHGVTEVFEGDLGQVVFKVQPKYAIKIIDGNIVFLFFHEIDKNKMFNALTVVNADDNVVDSGTTGGCNRDDVQATSATLNSVRHTEVHEIEAIKPSEVMDDDAKELKLQMEETIDKPVNKTETEVVKTKQWFPYFLVALGISVLKLLLSLPLYHSTDLEVHRHWMALTHHLPLAQWYYDETSIWTLDYPPYFAYFEKNLSYFAFFYDKDILVLQAEPSSTATTLLFLRLTVVCSDLVLLYAVYSYVDHCYQDIKKALITYILTVVNVALLLVDHIHFQYNGLLLGVLILCIDSGNRKRYVWMAMYYSILVLMKHLFVYIAPVIGFYLIIHYCDYGRYVTRFVSLVMIAIVNIVLAFAPFIYSSTAYYGVDFAMVQQIFQRLFPFGRGLLHAYWAPNAWAVYYFIDKIIAIVMKMDSSRTTSGVIGEYPTVCLVTITPLTTLVLNALLTIPALLYLHSHSMQQDILVKMVLYCSFSSFLFGYHVHEKAILVPLLLLGLVACSSERLANTYLRMVVVGTFSLFPLFEGENEFVIKVLLAISYTYCCTLLLDVGTINPLDYFLFFTILGCFLFTTIIHPNIPYMVAHLPFLPLMMTSVVCGAWNLKIFYDLIIVLFTTKK